MKKIGIYVHIPFCMSKCKYCDFNSYAGQEGLQRDYLIALIKEIKLYKKFSNKYLVDTIFIGGGTPSCMFPGAISTILVEIKKIFKVLDDAEVTIEVNPNTITLDKAIEWKTIGINRISIGLQTTNANILKLIGRTHNKKDYINGIGIIKEAGFNNINTDLMIGLPKQKSSDVKYAINLCSKLGCKHISCYSLILEENTLLYKLVCDGQLKLPKEAKTIGMYNTANQELSKLGYIRYEVSNFARKGYECKHNLNCWSMQEYLGFGAGAHGYVDNYRYNNISGIEEYIDSVNNNKKAIEEKCVCDKQGLYEETIMLGLRKTEGIDISTLDELLDCKFVEKYEKTINKYIELDMIKIEDGGIKVTDKGMYILNQIILDFVV